MAKFFGKAIEPPWIAYPGFPPADTFWRQSGEIWLHEIWRPYWHQLTETEKAAYLNKWPPPDVWQRFSIDLNPEFKAWLDSTDED